MAALIIKMSPRAALRRTKSRDATKYAKLIQK
jgi:hypothetical protein